MVRPSKRTNRINSALRDPEGAAYAQGLVSTALLRRLGASAASPEALKVLRGGGIPFPRGQLPRNRPVGNVVPWNLPTVAWESQLSHLAGLESAIAAERKRVKAVLEKAMKEGIPDSR